MKLFIKDRMMLMQVLPEAGNLADMLMVRKLQEKVGLTAKDHEKFKLRVGTKPCECAVGGQANSECPICKGKGEVPVEGTVQWDQKKDQGLDIEFRGPETALIVQALKKLDAEGKLTLQFVDICEKFGIGDEEK